MDPGREAKPPSRTKAGGRAWRGGLLFFRPKTPPAPIRLSAPKPRRPAAMPPPSAFAEIKEESRGAPDGARGGRGGAVGEAKNFPLPAKQGERVRVRGLLIERVDDDADKRHRSI